MPLGLWIIYSTRPIDNLFKIPMRAEHGKNKIESFKNTSRSKCLSNQYQQKQKELEYSMCAPHIVLTFLYKL